MPSRSHPAVKVVVTGPESSGKSSLAASLADRLQAPWAPEFARYALESLGRPYRQEDLEWIARGQRAWELWYRRRSPQGLLIADTDWTVLHIWESYRFGRADQPFWRRGYGPPEPADLYLLCRPDFPWAPDPLREHPEERQQLFDLYHELLLRLPAPFFILAGDPDTRLNNALEIIRQTFGYLPRPPG